MLDSYISCVICVIAREFPQFRGEIGQMNIPERGLYGLVAAIVDSSADLVGAEVACDGRGELFEPSGKGEDSDDLDYRHAAAVSLCGQCPAVPACRRWFARQPRSRWGGWIIAGQRITYTKKEHP